MKMNYSWSEPSAKERINQNNARIAQLKADLQRLKGGSISDMDLLDLELASNRANAYDMGGATTALSRIDSRMTNRAKEVLDAQKEKRLKDYENYVKISELQDKYRQLQIEQSKTQTQADYDLYDSQLKHIAEQIKTLNGTPDPAYQGPSVAPVMDDFYSSTTNTSKGLKFNDDVDADHRKELVNNLRMVGKYKEADELEAMKTKAEKDADTAKARAKQKKLKAGFNKAIKKIAELEQEMDKNPSEAIAIELGKYENYVDSLKVNNPESIGIENGKYKWIAKER